MCSHCIIGNRVTFFAQVKVAFAHLEEYLYVPTLSIDPDDFILIQIYISGNKTKLLLAFVAVANINYFGRNDFTIYYNINHNREQIS